MMLLQPLKLPEIVRDNVTIDFIEVLPKSEGLTIILEVIDHLSKYGHFIQLRHPFTTLL